MIDEDALHVRALTQRLVEAEATVAALLSGQIDAVVDPTSQTPVLLGEAQKALRASEERYRRIVETANEGIFTTDVDATLTFVNGRFSRMLGYSVVEMLGRTLGEFLPQVARQVTHPEGRNLAADGTSEDAEIQFVRKDGSALWAQLNTSQIHDSDGRIVGALTMVTDRTRHRSDQTALRESETRFRRLADSGIIGVVIAHLGGQVIEANDAYLGMVGLSRSDISFDNRLLTQLTPPEFHHLNDLARAQLRTLGYAAPWETESFRKDGSRVSLLAGMAMLEDDKYIAIMSDITERKRAEAARVHAEESLRRKEDQLRQGQKMEAVGRLAGGVAHDFNNVLSVILSYGELILEDLKPADPLRVEISEIHKAASRAASLTHQLLLLSRQKVIEPKVVVLADVLTGMQTMLERILGEDVELTVAIDATASGRVSVDESHMEQVILNLVVNARDAMPKGGHLTIETSNVVLTQECTSRHGPVKEGRYVMMSVTDTGSGMDRETQTRIFEPFFTTKEAGKGTGLGLATVFGIVQQSGGNITVESEPGTGTTFRIYLPRVDAAVDVPRISLHPAPLGGTETILLVEDEDAVRSVAMSILRRQGYRVLPAQHPGGALLICERHQGPIDFLLTDVVMPQMSAPELAKRLAAMRPHMKVLCMSGYTDDAVLWHGVSVMDAFVQKPITPARLTKKVREVLDGQRTLIATSPPAADSL